MSRVREQEAVVSAVQREDAQAGDGMKNWIKAVGILGVMCGFLATLFFGPKWVVFIPAGIAAIGLAYVLKLHFDSQDDLNERIRK